MRYEVQHYTICDGWVNTWSIVHHDGRVEPETFESYEDAAAALAEFFGEIAEEIAIGQRRPDEGFDSDEFQIVKAGAS